MAAKKKVNGRISAEWTKIIAALARFDSFTRADVAAVAKRHGRPFGMARFVASGIFKRIKPGLYRVAGAKAPAGVKTQPAPKPKKAKPRKAPRRKTKPETATPPASEGGAR